MKTTAIAKDIDDYISRYPAAIQEKLQQMRQAITEAAPNAKEIISYGMPAFKQNGTLVYFAAHKEHLGFYPTGSGIREFESEFSKFNYSKGAVQFPYTQRLPVALIKRIVKFRSKQDAEKAKLKGLRKK